MAPGPIIPTNTVLLNKSLMLVYIRVKQISPDLSFLTLMQLFKMEVSVSTLNRWNKDVKSC